MTFQQELTRFLGQKYSSEIDENEPLIDRGLIDSLGLLEILTFIEERTGTRVPDEEVTHENFQTVASIERLVQRLTSQGGSPSG